MKTYTEESFISVVRKPTLDNGKHKVGNWGTKLKDNLPKINMNITGEYKINGVELDIAAVFVSDLEAIYSLPEDKVEKALQDYITIRQAGCASLLQYNVAKKGTAGIEASKFVEHKLTGRTSKEYRSTVLKNGLGIKENIEPLETIISEYLDLSEKDKTKAKLDSLFASLVILIYPEDKQEEYNSRKEKEEKDKEMFKHFFENGFITVNRIPEKEDIVGTTTSDKSQQIQRYLNDNGYAIVSNSFDMATGILTVYFGQKPENAEKLK